MKWAPLFLWNDSLDKQVVMEGDHRGKIGLVQKVLILFHRLRLQGFGRCVRMGWGASIVMILRLIDGRLV